MAQPVRFFDFMEDEVRVCAFCVHAGVSLAANGVYLSTPLIFCNNEAALAAYSDVEPDYTCELFTAFGEENSIART